MTERSSGILLHPTSLPGGSGIGDLGPGARRFLDWLTAAGQGLWQILPLGPVGLGNSPYNPESAFAGNPLLISLEELLDDGLVERGDLAGAPRARVGGVDFAAVRGFKAAILRRAWERWLSGPRPRELEDAWRGFLAAPEQEPWLGDWTLYAALKEDSGGRAWGGWPRELRLRQPEALAAARRELEGEIDFQAFVQFLFFRQWRRLRAAAARRRIRILGDLPIYVAPDSADVWSRQELFDLDEEGRARTVAGVPPDYFSSTGQRWGNPIYRWDRIEEAGFAWWIERVRANLRLADLVRIDHFRGLVAYWEVDAAAETAREGRWRSGPGRRLFDALGDALGELPLVAEDLGLITPDVEELRRDLGLPGMKVLQFGFDEVDGPHAPHRLTRDTVVYTGTHDNDTARGWYEQAPARQRRRALDYLGGDEADIAWQLLRAAWTSVADTAIAPVQDVLGLGSEARLNTPGTSAGNWEWRLAEGALDDALAARLRRLTEVAGRLSGEGRA